VLCMAKDDRHGGEVKTSNDAASTRCQPYGLGAGLERSSPLTMSLLECPTTTPRLPCKASMEEFARRNILKRRVIAACTSGCSTLC
jgi:hypothetical protein